MMTGPTENDPMPIEQVRTYSHAFINKYSYYTEQDQTGQTLLHKRNFLALRQRCHQRLALLLRVLLGRRIFLCGRLLRLPRGADLIRRTDRIRFVGFRLFFGWSRGILVF